MGGSDHPRTQFVREYKSTATFSSQVLHGEGGGSKPQELPRKGWGLSLRGRTLADICGRPLDPVPQIAQHQVKTQAPERTGPVHLS